MQRNLCLLSYLQFGLLAWFPEAQDYADVATTMQLQQGFVTGEMGFKGQFHGNNLEPLMSALGQKRTWRDQIAMSALPPIADIARGGLDVRFGPKADIRRYSITSSASSNIDGGTVSPSVLAVLAFTAISNFTGTWTGRSAGLAPRSI